MSPLRTYKHKDTGKVGEYSDAVAALFPDLQLLDEAVVEEPASVTQETQSGDAATKSKGKADQ